MLWGIVRHKLFLAYKGHFFKVEITSTSLDFMEWGCMDSNQVEGFNNLGIKRVSYLV
jgi:hypothetical protein